MRWDRAFMMKILKMLKFIRNLIADKVWIFIKALYWMIRNTIDKGYKSYYTFGIWGYYV